MQIVITEKHLSFLKFVCPPLTVLVWAVMGIIGLLPKVGPWFKEEWKTIFTVVGIILLMLLIVVWFYGSIALMIHCFSTGHYIWGAIVANFWIAIMWFIQSRKPNP